ncbi:MAG: single-stranded-DNA-specific exonuclease RecJ [Candidatus Magasanikbacteria bacterium]
MPKKWIISPAVPNEFLNSHPELPPIVARLLYNRNIKTQEKIDEFLNPDYSEDIHDPFLFDDMEKAVEIILSHVKQQKNIVVHGDYDADGVCAAAIIVSCLQKIGAQHVSVFLPHRETDGYGLNFNTVKDLKKKNTDLIITCDCGVSNTPEVQMVKELGMMIIITDHHSVPANIPPADAIIHPKMPNETYPDKGLCGGAVAFKLVQALLKKHQATNSTLLDGQSHEAFEKWLLDLVAIASIGDMVPLIGESRTLTRYGLTVLNKTHNLGLKKLMFVAGIMDENDQPKRGVIEAHTVGYQIVPRLNAAGRMDHANSAYALLMATDEREAENLAEQLNQNNLDRQKLTEGLVNQAIQQIKETEQEKNSALFAFSEDWPTGVLGLVSGRLKDIFYKPALAMGKSSDGEIVGSGRSISEFNLIAAMQERPEFFDKFGGHPQACGFTLKSKSALEEFKKFLNEKVVAETKGVELVPQVNIDSEVDLDEIDWDMYDLLQKFEPFGMNNEEPIYAAYGLTIINIDPVGQDGKHLRMKLKHNSQVIRKTIGFGLGDTTKHPDDWKNNLHPGEKIDIAFCVEVNKWNGNRELQMTIHDIKKSVLN